MTQFDPRSPEGLALSKVVSSVIPDLAVFLTMLREISRFSGIGSGAITAARLVLNSGSASLASWEGNSTEQTDKNKQKIRDHRQKSL